MLLPVTFFFFISTTGRKRGRQSAKITEIAESSANVSVDVVETPVTKSRRGRRGKTAQTEEAVSVLETPLQTVSLVDIIERKLLPVKGDISL